MSRYSKYGPYKQGDKHPDGRVFYRYEKGKEIWVTEEIYLHKINIKKEYYQATAKEYKKKTHPPIYHSVDGLYFVGMSNGKERWVTYNEYLRIKKGREIKRNRYYQKQKKLIKIKYTLGQQHPENPELYFAGYNNSNARWLDYESYKKRREMMKEVNRKSLIKQRIRKAKLLDLIKNKIKIGTEKNGLKFWDYGSYGNEIWIKPEIFEQRRIAQRQKSKKHYDKRKKENENTK